MLYRTIGNLTSWIFPTHEDRKKYRNLCREIDDRKKLKQIHKHYQIILSRLRKKYKNKEKIKVVFLCSDNTKWCYQSLYEELSKNDLFIPLVAVAITNDLLQLDNTFLDYRKKIKENYDFFYKRKMNVLYVFNVNTKEYMPLKNLNPDIVFYEQPWGLSEKHMPHTLDRTALTLHCSYGTSITNGDYEYTKVFYRELFRYFLDNIYIQEKFIENGYDKENIPILGSLKLDSYKKQINEENILWKTKSKKRVIWAPHHSFSKESILKYGTFDWNYKHIYEYAKQHQDIEFILKPHPVLKKSIVNENLMSKDEMTDYFVRWENLPNAQICDKGDYFDMFRTSDLLITDCCSFLSEYLPTNKPIIHLISENSTGYNKYGAEIIKANYQVKNNRELDEILDKILYQNEDSKQKQRKDIVSNKLYITSESVARKIINHIEELLRR